MYIYIRIYICICSYIYIYIYMSRFIKSEATVFLFFRFESLTSQKLPVCFRKLPGSRKTNGATSYFCYFRLLDIFGLIWNWFSKIRDEFD